MSPACGRGSAARRNGSLLEDRRHKVRLATLSQRIGARRLGGGFAASARLTEVKRDFPRRGDGRQRRGTRLPSFYRAKAGETSLRGRDFPRRRRPTASRERLPSFSGSKPAKPASRAGLPRRRRPTASGETASIILPGQSRRNPLRGRNFRAADGRQHRGTRPPSLYRAKAGETRFAGGTSAPQTADSIGGHGFHHSTGPKPAKTRFAGGTSAPIQPRPVCLVTFPLFRNAKTGGLAYPTPHST